MFTFERGFLTFQFRDIKNFWQTFPKFRNISWITLEKRILIPKKIILKEIFYQKQIT
jgi:hypothetical protein